MISSISPIFQRGVTLIELMITISLAITAFSLTAPALSSFIRQVRLYSATNELHHAIMLTRTEAVSRNRSVDLAAIDGNWKNGWVITGTDKKQIMVHEPLHSDIQINASFSDGTQHIAYSGTGRSLSRLNSHASQFGHVQLSLGEHTRIIFVNILGRTRICNPSLDKYCVASSPD